MTALGFQRVRPTGAPSGSAQIVDVQSREVLVIRVNLNGLAGHYAANSHPLTPIYPISPAAHQAGRCPPADPAVESMPVCRRDFAQLGSFDCDAIRLVISWSQLEPAPGRISGIYLDRIAQLIAAPAPPASACS